MFRRIFICLSLGLAPGVALAQAPRPRASEASRDAELARLQQEVSELRQMLIQAMQVEQQHYDLLLKLLQSGGGARGLPALPAPAAPASAGRREPRAPTSATISGTVEVKGASAGQAVYVFVENVRGPAARGRSLEIAQKDKQFSPQVAVVPWGTSVYFPNGDRVAHNVFSMSKRTTFDLGILKAGERGSPVVMREPGLVEVFCDIHERMWASLLVVPNGMFVKVAPDGKYRLPNVPLGERVIAAWTAGSDPVRRTVQVEEESAQADFTLSVVGRKSHNNKVGQPYGSYGE
jgi:plastocyanin